MYILYKEEHTQRVKSSALNKEKGQREYSEILEDSLVSLPILVYIMSFLTISQMPGKATENFDIDIACPLSQTARSTTLSAENKYFLTLLSSTLINPKPPSTKAWTFLCFCGPRADYLILLRKHCFLKHQLMSEPMNAFK